MPVKGKKSLPIDEETHRLISIESATSGKTMSDLIAEAWDAHKAKGNFSSRDSLLPVNSRDRIASESANPFANLTDKEAAAALAIVEILRGPDELDARTVHLLIDRWRLKYGDPGLPRGVHRRKRA